MIRERVQRIGLIAGIFFVPSALIVGGFFYFVSAVFQEEIYLFDDGAVAIAEDLFNDQDSFEEVAPFAVSSVAFDDGGLDAVITEDEWETLSDRDIDQRLVEAGYEPIGDEEYPLYDLAPVEVDLLSDEEWSQYELLLDDWEEDVYEAAISELMPVLYGLLGVVFVLSCVAAYIMVRPLERSLARQKQFIADASHEIKTPLALMQSEIDLFEKEYHNQDPESQHVMQVMGRLRDDVRRLSRLAERLLVLARLDAQEAQEGGLSNCSYKDVMELLGRLSDRFNENYSHTVSYTNSCNIGDVIVCERRLEQVLEILLENACMHTPPHTLVELETVCVGNRLVIRVQDSGPGIPREHINHIFDRFYRVDDSRHVPGNGLGLAIARELVEKDGGQIRVTSSGEGTTFEVSYQLRT